MEKEITGGTMPDNGLPWQNADPLGSSAATVYGVWVAVEDRLPDYNKKVLALDGDNMFCAILQNVTRHIGKDSPRDNRWFALPGWGHELKGVTDWCDLPKAP